MRPLVLLTAAAIAPAQTFELSPASPRQGDSIRITAPAPAASARMNNRSIRLFPQPDGSRLGLMPVPVLEKPGKYELEIAGPDGDTLHTAPVTVRDARFPIQNVVLGKEVAALKPAPGEMETVAAFRQTVSDLRHWAEPPFRAPIPGCMISRFGVRRFHNGKPTGNYHGGIDQRGPEGHPVRAVAGGTVRIVRMWNIHGGTVGIDHGQGLSSIYLHLLKFAVAEGATVNAGNVIGYIGSTGRSTAPHLHWSIYANGVPVNPLQWTPVKPCATSATKKTRR